jgi:flagellar biosynthetic protein FliQ
MSIDQSLQLVTQSLWTAFLIAAPILFSTLVIGVLIGVFQVVTQLQEMTLTFVPKLIMVFVVFLVLGPWMLNRLTTFASTLYRSIPNIS